MNSSRKKISVIIPFYKDVQTLDVCLVSIKNQTFKKKDYEVLLINDGSPYSIKDSLRKYGDHSNFRYIKYSRNKGRSYARNLGIKEARGEIIVFIDSDIISPPELLSAHEDYHRSNKNTFLWGLRHKTDWPAMNDSPQKSIFSPYSGLHIRDFREFILSDSQYRSAFEIEPWFFLGTCHASIPKWMINRAGGFDENFKGWGVEDIELAYRVLQTVPEAKVKYWNEFSCMHAAHYRNAKVNHVELIQNAKYMLKKYPSFEIELVIAYFGREFLRRIRYYRNLILPNRFPKDSNTGSIQPYDLVLGPNLGSMTCFIQGEPREYSLLGLLLPYDDKVFRNCLVKDCLDLYLLEDIPVLLKELDRVADKVRLFYPSNSVLTRLITTLLKNNGFVFNASRNNGRQTILYKKQGN